MSIPIWDSKTGKVFIRAFDEAIIRQLGGSPDQSLDDLKDLTDPNDPCFGLNVPFPGGQIQRVRVYFSQPEAAFQKKVFPMVVINRDDMPLAMQRYMGPTQLEYRAGVSGTEYVDPTTGVSGFLDYESKFAAFPYDFIYTISVWDRYETPAQVISQQVLKAFPPIGRIIVYDDLNVQRGYDYFQEGSIVSLQELIDPVTRVRGYAVTIRVEGEIDYTDTYTSLGVSGIFVDVKRF